MPKIFISHASEDKAALADPLAHALKEKYEVWYDRFELTAGDSLLGKINEGLSSSDFGVVILSPSFFQKKWTRSELDGLMALETKNRKVILPIWFKVGEVEVKTASPILAGRYGIDGSLPIEGIVGEIRRAIEVAECVSTFSDENSAIVRLRGIAQKQQGLKDAEKLEHSKDGVAQMKQEVDDCRKKLREHVNALAAAFPSSTFRSEFNRYGSLEVFGPHNVMLVVQFSSEEDNYVPGAVFRYVIAIKEPHCEPTGFLHEIRLKPSFTHELRLIWADSKGNTYTTSELSDAMLNKFTDEIEKAEE
jgi:hypothetical protein